MMTAFDMTEKYVTSSVVGVRFPRERVGGMAETQSAPRWGATREEIREPLRRLVERLAAGLGDNLQSVTVVGSSLTEDFRPGSSEIDTVIVVGRHDIGALDVVAALFGWRKRHGLAPPLLMTPRDIEGSRDVFGVELLDFQQTHETILGTDPFAALQIEKPDVRRQCVRELKAMRFRLRQAYLAAGGDPRLLRDVLLATAKGLASVGRAMLWLQDTWRPRTMAGALRSAGGEFGVDVEEVIAVERWRHENVCLTEAQLESAFLECAGVVELLTLAVEQMEV
jgi:hypothetical protein